MGCTRGPVGRAESDRGSAMSYVFKRVLEVRTRRFYGCGLVNLVDLMNLRKALKKGLPLLEGAHPLL